MSARRPGLRGVTPTPLGILLISGGHERAHYALVLATGAAAVGRDVVLFATNAGCRLFEADAARWKPIRAKRCWPGAASPASARCSPPPRSSASAASPARPG